MTVPLLLNAFVLCPLALRRLRRAVYGGLKPEDLKRAVRSGALYGFLSLGTAAYLVLVQLH